ncbi:MAG: alpha/beta family hydrolase [Actinomycetota bacterium]
MKPSGLILTHGAGGGADHRLLVALEDQLDLPVRRMEFPYRAEGRKAPDRAPKLIASVLDEAARFAAELGCEPADVALGGRSMGGRICSMAIAEGLPAAAVLLLSYPLHPPGKPDRLRTEHFPDLTVPTLFINGDRDPFGTPDELAAHVPQIAGPTMVHWLAGQRHDPKPEFDDEIVAVVQTFLDGLSGR